jgi:hypothetical protein
MGLMIGGGGGAAKVYLKYNAKSGRWSVRNLDGSENEVADPTFIADLDNIATGWMKFVEGQPPSRVIDPSTTSPAPKPSEDHKRGFILGVYSKNLFGGVAEISGTSNVLANVIKNLYAQFEAEKGANAGKVPVVQCKGTVAEKSKYGTNYAPNISIAKWIERPADLPDESPAHPNDIYRATSTAAPAPAAGGHVPPPAPKLPTSQATEF